MEPTEILEAAFDVCPGTMYTCACDILRSRKRLIELLPEKNHPCVKGSIREEKYFLVRQLKQYWRFAGNSKTRNPQPVCLS